LAAQKVKLDNQLINAQAKQEATTKAYREELAKTRLENTRLNKEAKKTVELQNDATGAYRKATIRLADLKRELKDAAIAGDKNEVSIKDLRQEYDKLNKEVRQADQELGDFSRNVGNYGSAFDGFGDKVEGLGQGLGGIVSGQQGAGGVGSAITGVVGKLGPVGVAAAGAVSGVVALGSAVVDLDQEFDELRGTIEQLTGLEGNQLDALTSTIKALETTFGADTNESLRAANVLIKEFGLSGVEAANFIEQGFLSNANVQGDLLDGVIEYSTQIKAAGGDANDLFKILDASGTAGVFSDKGIDTVKEFGLRIREQTTSTTDALTAAFGGDFTNDLFGRINDGSTTTIEALQEVTDKLKFTNLAAKDRQTVIADVFGGAGEDAGSFLETLTQINFETAFQADLTGDLAQKKQAELDANKGLADAQNELSKAIGDSSEIGRVWTQILTFIVTELTNAFERINFVIKGFGLFKDSLYNKFIDPLNDGIKVFNNFTNSLGLGDVISEFDRATGTLDEFNAKRREQIAISIEATRIIKEGVLEQKNEINGFKNLTKSIGDANVPREKQIENILEVQKQYPEMLQGYTEENLQNANLVDIKNNLNRQFTEELINRKKALALRALDNELLRRENVILKLKEGDAKNAAIDELNRLRVFGLQKIEAVEEETKILLGLKEAETDELNDLSDDVAGNAIGNDQKRLDSFKSTSEKIIDQAEVEEQRLTDLRTQRQKDIDENEKQNQKTKEENLKNEQDRINKINAQQEKDEELRRKREQKAEQEKQKQQEDERKQNYEDRGELIKAFTDKAIENIDERIKKLDDEIDAAQKQADFFKELAANGNINAQQSLAEQNQIIAEAEAKRQKIEKRKQAIELVSSVVTAYNNELGEGKTTQEALKEAFLGTGTMTAFIAALPTFLDGIENTGTHGAGIDGKGGFLSVLHPNERVLTKEQNAMIGDHSNEEVAEIMHNYRFGAYDINPVIIDNNKINTASLEAKLDDVKNAITNKPDIDVIKLTSTAMMIKETQKKGNFKTTNRFKVN
jgi:hypothetical protein